MIWETAKTSMSLQCPKRIQLRGSDHAQGRWGESPCWHVGTCPYFWLDPFISAWLLLLVAGTTAKARKKLMPSLAGREEDNDERGETGKHQPWQLFLNLLACGRQYGLCVKKTPSAALIEKTPAIWPSFRSEKSHCFNVTTKSPQILPLLHFLCTQKHCRLQTASSKGNGASSLQPRPQQMKVGIPGNCYGTPGDSP